MSEASPPGAHSHPRGQQPTPRDPTDPPARPSTGGRLPPMISCSMSHDMRIAGVRWTSLDAAVIRDPLDEEGLTLCLSWDYMLKRRPGTLPRPRVGLSRGRPRRSGCSWGRWPSQMAVLQVQLSRKRGLQALASSTERGCLMCAHTPIFYQLSKSDGQKRD